SEKLSEQEAISQSEETGKAEEGEESGESRESQEVRKSQEAAESFENRIVMANVKDTLNVRQEPGENAVKEGYLYKDCGGEILERRDGWTKLKSGNLVGWARDDYLLFGEEASALYQEVGNKTARVKGDALRVRKEASTEAGVYGLVGAGETLDVTEEGPEWIGVNYEGDEGYVSKEFVDILFTVDHGETLEEIKEREKKARELALKSNLQKAKNADEKLLLGALVQCEAGNQSFEGKVAVAAVVMTRVRSSGYPNSIPGVIYASGQFTPAISGKVMKVYDIGVRDECVQAAVQAMNGYSNVGSATHFKRVGLHTGGQVIGNHIFW
ncbi:MAG: cell wall hydrolase, partial [Lachnospiraceae bacterium]|nr:cell wall hydrolase [Lachnospiraceae bacterium]